jgi:hypothetical protein
MKMATMPPRINTTVWIRNSGKSIPGIGATALLLTVIPEKINGVKPTRKRKPVSITHPNSHFLGRVIIAFGKVKRKRKTKRFIRDPNAITIRERNNFVCISLNTPNSVFTARYMVRIKTSEEKSLFVALF